MHILIEKDYLEYLFASLQIESLPSELKFYFQGENSIFLRINNSKIRQITHVDQFELKVCLKEHDKEINLKVGLTGNLMEDQNRLVNLLKEKLNFNVEVKSDHLDFTTKHLETNSNDIQDVLTVIQTTNDLVGLFTFGNITRAFIKGGQTLVQWFESKRFDIDYSLYRNSNSVKEFYSQKEFSKEDLKNSIEKNITILNSMDKDKVELKPGKLDVFLSPGAVCEFLSVFNWHGVQGKAIGEKQSAFMDSYNDKRHLSKKFQLRENFELALAPNFNEEGEISKDIIEIFKDGKLVAPLVNSTTENRFSLKSNFANSSESIRCGELLSGDKSEYELLQNLKHGIYISDVHYLNWSNKKTATVTGMTRFGCFYIDEDGNQHPIKDMRFNVSLYDLFGTDLVDFTQERKLYCDSNTYERRHTMGMLVPGALTKLSFTL